MEALSGTVVVAMSGGVDSSVAAALTAESGARTVGVTLKLLGRSETGFGCCGSPADVEDAKRVCEALGIPHYALELSRLFEDEVVGPFVRAALSLETPNPCVECNRRVKFGYLLALCEAWGAEALATGHYARSEGGRLLAAKDEAKDQSYFLYTLGPRELSRARFPLGGLKKAEVREKARALGLATADKPESQELCFVPGRDARGFLASRPESAGAFVPGPVEERGGGPVGRHAGLPAFTIGQRRGLGLGGGKARFVVGFRPESNALVVGSEEETLSSGFLVRDPRWTSGREPGRVFRASVRLRHRHRPAPAEVSPLEGGRLRVRLEEPQRAVTPGQAAVFYRGEEVLGGGTIDSREEP